jgi:DNA repair photolyase
MTIQKKFNGKAIYNPSGKAGEYNYWACNFYVGCSNGCTYCYLKKGMTAATLGGNKPTLKKCFKDEEHAIAVFKKEVEQNLHELRKHGLFLSFTTDPMLNETIYLTYRVIAICQVFKVPVKILTKSVENLKRITSAKSWDRSIIGIGVTLTGRDALEPNASTNEQRVNALSHSHFIGFKTFASIEPVIDFDKSLELIRQAAPICHLIKIGLESGKIYPKSDVINFLRWVEALNGTKIYIKESLRKYTKRHLFLSPSFVERDYNLFNE